MWPNREETDRLLATVTELGRLGQDVQIHDSGDGFLITPKKLKPTTTPVTIECYNDHRMAMSFAVLAAAVRPDDWDLSVPVANRVIRIADPACTAKTYPGFWDDLAKLYPERPW